MLPQCLSCKDVQEILGYLDGLLLSPDNRSIGDRGMVDQERFQLGWRNLEQGSIKVSVWCQYSNRRAWEKALDASRTWQHSARRRELSNESGNKGRAKGSGLVKENGH
jgi:hypothetical protein